MYVRTRITFDLILASTSNLHDRMTQTLLRATILFFDSNPIGRILTRFAKDMTMCDLTMPYVANFASVFIFRGFFVCLIICTINPWLLIVLSGVMVGFVYCYKLGTPAMIAS